MRFYESQSGLAGPNFLLRSPMNLDRPIVERDILDFFFSECAESFFFFFLILLFAESTRKEWSNGRIGQNYFFFFELITEI